jgi:NADPH oxidase 1
MLSGRSYTGASSRTDGTVQLELFNRDRHSQATDQKLALLNTLQFSVWISRGAGLVLAMDGFLIMLAVCRNVIRFLRPKIRVLPLDENLWFHRQTAYMLLLFAIIHTTAHYVNFFVHCTPAKLIVEC